MTDEAKKQLLNILNAEISNRRQEWNQLNRSADKLQAEIDGIQLSIRKIEGMK